MKITCKSLGETKLLTIGNEYEVINESDNRYTILNDKGIQKNYAKNLFDVFVEVPPVPAKIIINELNIETNADSIGDEEDGYSDINVSIEIKGDNNFDFKYKLGGIESYDSEISCGVSQLTGINSMMLAFANLKYNLKEYISENNFELNEEINLNDTLKDIKSGVLQDITAEVSESNQSCGILLISTNITDNKDLDDDIVELLDEMSVSVNEFNNPNSGNTCKIWNINLNE